MGGSQPTPRDDRALADHYSREVYADAEAPERFWQRHFSGALGAYLQEHQAAVLTRYLPEGADAVLLDLGGGTGRAAQVARGLALRTVTVDASLSMLLVARRSSATAVRADGHVLPFPDEAFIGVVALRLLMHVADWRRVIAELCRVARDIVIVDFPPLSSAAALAPLLHPLLAWRRPSYQPYRVLGVGAVRRELAGHGFRVLAVERQLVLPFAFHRALARPAVTRGVESVLRGVGLTRLVGAPATVVAQRVAP